MTKLTLQVLLLLLQATSTTLEPFLMGFGGIIAILDRRYRRARAHQQQPVTPAEQATVV
ncbi:MAG: hypothetical protein ACO31Z_05080 [Litorivicinaceae bacterium]